MKTIHKILILRFSSLGDIIMATAMVRCLRLAFPAAQIDMVVRKDFLDLIKDNPHLNRKWALSRGEGIRGLWDLRRSIQQENYDLIYDAHRSLRTRLLMPFLKSPHKAYYQKHYFRRAVALTLKLRLLDRKRMLERYLEPLESFGVRYDGMGPEVFFSKEDQQRGFAKLNLTPEGSFIGLIPSAQWPGKRWSPHNFRQVLEKLVDQVSAPLLVFGGREDTFCDDICRGFSADRVINAQGKLSIAEAAAVIQKCRLVVANDTGLMHIADAVGVPSVLILGPTSAEMGCLPFHPQAQIVEESLWCRPCSKNGQAPCIRGTRLCLERISPERVVTSTLGLLKEAH